MDPKKAEETLQLMEVLLKEGIINEKDYESKRKDVSCLWNHCSQNYILTVMSKERKVGRN